MFKYFTILLIQRGGGKFTVPYDSTQGVPGIVFVFFWIIIFAFLGRMAWEYRDKIFKSKDSSENQRKQR